MGFKNTKPFAVTVPGVGVVAPAPSVTDAGPASKSSKKKAAAVVADEQPEEGDES